MSGGYLEDHDSLFLKRVGNQMPDAWVITCQTADLKIRHQAANLQIRCPMPVAEISCLEGTSGTSCKVDHFISAC